MLPSVRPVQVDLLALLRQLVSWRTLVLLALGAALGHGAGLARGQVHGAAFAVKLPPFRCPGGAAPNDAYGQQFPASLLEGFERFDDHVPSQLVDERVRCSFAESATGGVASCAVLAADEPEARRLASKARSELVHPLESGLGMAIVEERIVGGCSWDALVELNTGAEVAPTARGSQASSTAALVQFRRALAESAEVTELPPPAPTPLTKAGVIVGALLGLFAAAALALRALPESSVPEPTGDRNLFGTLALGGLLLTLSMDTVLRADVGPFTLRVGHVFALALFLIGTVRALRSGLPVTLPRRVLFAALLWLSLASLSVLWSGQPVKSLGYLAWATFDLIVVLVGIRMYVDGAERLRTALSLWCAGLFVAAGMGAVQILCWLSGRGAPLVWMTNDGFPRINGFSYEPSYYCLYLVPGAYLLLTRFALLGKPAWKSGVAAVALLVAVGLSTSRSGWIGAVAGILILGVRAYRRRGLSGFTRAAGLFASLLVALGVILLAWPTLRVHTVQLAQMAFDRFEKSSTGPRLESLRQAAVLTRRHPVLGVGLAGYGAYVLDHPELPQPRGQTAYAVVTTNVYLEQSAETGLLGLAAVLVLLWTLIAPLLTRRGDDGTLDAQAADREGLFVAALLAFGVLFQFCQTLWRLDIWALVSLCFAAAQATAARAAKRPEVAPAEAHAGGATSPQTVTASSGRGL